MTLIDSLLVRTFATIGVDRRGLRQIEPFSTGLEGENASGTHDRADK